LTQEALFLLDNGYATAEEIDEAARSSFALRTPFLGVVKRFDYAGLDLTQKILRNRQYAPPQLIDRSLPSTVWWKPETWGSRRAGGSTTTAAAARRISPASGTASC